MLTSLRALMHLTVKMSYCWSSLDYMSLLTAPMKTDKSSWIEPGFQTSALVNCTV